MNTHSTFLRDMKQVTIFFLPFLALLTNAAQIIDIIEQPLDHFNGNLKSTIRQRYMTWLSGSANDSGHVIILYLNGEGPLDPWLYNGTSLIRDPLKASFFLLEHRFYGESLPNEDTRNNTILQYLTMAQAIEDTRQFIAAMNSLYKFDKPNWILMGCSYTGILAALARAELSNITTAAYASSAPVKRVIESPDYDRIVSRVLRGSSEECLQAVVTLEKPRYANTFIGACKIVQKNHSEWICEDADVLPSFLGQIIQNAGEETLKPFCSTLVSAAKTLENMTDLNGADQAIAQYFAGSGVALGRQWYYQICREIGLFQPLGDDIAMYRSTSRQMAKCSRFGMDERQVRRNILQGANKYEDYYFPKMNNVFFINGANDPWQGAGEYRKDFTRNIKSLVIPNGCHCPDLGDDIKQNEKTADEFVNFVHDSISGERHCPGSSEDSSVSTIFSFVSTFIVSVVLLVR